MWIAPGLGGEYAIQRDAANFILWRVDDPYAFDTFPTVEAAKAHAETDWQKTIGRKLIATPPAGRWRNGDYTPTEAMVEAGREYMPRSVSEEAVVRAFMEMMKQGEIDGVVGSPESWDLPDELGVQCLLAATPPGDVLGGEGEGR